MSESNENAKEDELSVANGVGNVKVVAVQAPVPAKAPPTAADNSENPSQSPAVPTVASPWLVLSPKTREILSNIQEADWKAQYFQLAHFRFIHGHFSVLVSKDPKLVDWMAKQQMLYDVFLQQFEGEDHKLTTEIVRSMFEKIELLRILGFTFHRSHLMGTSNRSVPPVAENKDKNSNEEEESSAKKKSNKRNSNWDSNFIAVREFRDEHGHCDCPNPSLRGWVTRQRKRIRGESKNAAPLTDYEIQRLEDIGILKLTKKSLQATPPEKDGGAASTEEIPKNLRDPELFDQMYEEMKKFWQENGHTVVPEKNHGKLRRFLVDVRREYKKIMNGQTSEFLTQDRIERLKQIDFSFEARIKCTFDERFEQWLQYRLDHNGMNPTTKSALGKWVSKTRMRYHDTMDGKQVSYSTDSIHHLTEGQIKKLKLHGFDFGKRDYNRAPKTWDERFEELLEYRAEYGNVDVPQKFPSLGDWVHKQRQRRYQLSQDKVDKLEEVGFTWLTRKRPTRRNKPTSENDTAQDKGSSSTDDESDFRASFPY